MSEFREKLRLLLRCHADAGVADCKLDPVAAVGDLSRRELDLALLGEFASVAQQVEQDLPHPHGIGNQRTQVLLHLDNEPIAVLLRELAGGADDLIDQRSEIDALRVEFQLAGFDLGEIEHLVDQAAQMSASRVNALERVQCLLELRTAARW